MKYALLQTQFILDIQMMQQGNSATMGHWYWMEYWNHRGLTFRELGYLCALSYLCLVFNSVILGKLI